MKIYNRLTDGHGAGAAELYRGEAYSVQGRFEESDIQAYQAAFLSEQAGNATVTPPRRKSCKPTLSGDVKSG